MKNESEARDRVALKMRASFPDGEHNAELEIEADEDGLQLDIGVFIPWEWIHAANAAVLSNRESRLSSGEFPPPGRGRC